MGWSHWRSKLEATDFPAPRPPEMNEAYFAQIRNVGSWVLRDPADCAMVK